MTLDRLRQRLAQPALSALSTSVAALAGADGVSWLRPADLFHPAIEGALLTVLRWVDS
jgi:hypothetical protein